MESSIINEDDPPADAGAAPDLTGNANPVDLIKKNQNYLKIAQDTVSKTDQNLYADSTFQPRFNDLLAAPPFKSVDDAEKWGRSKAVLTGKDTTGKSVNPKSLFNAQQAAYKAVLAQYQKDQVQGKAGSDAAAQAGKDAILRNDHPEGDKDKKDGEEKKGGTEAHADPTQKFKEEFKKARQAGLPIFTFSKNQKQYNTRYKEELKNPDAWVANLKKARGGKDFTPEEQAAIDKVRGGAAEHKGDTASAVDGSFKGPSYTPKQPNKDRAAKLTAMLNGDNKDKAEAALKRLVDIMNKQRAASQPATLD